MSSVDSAHHTEKMLLAQQEFLREEADAERIRLNKQEFVLDQEEYYWSWLRETWDSCQ